MYDVFISYSRKDSMIADEICSAFNKYGITFFIDRKGISGGVEFTEVIAEAIESSRVFLFLGSANSYASKYAVNEVTYAYGEKPKNSIIPYKIDNAPMPKNLKFLFSNLNIRNIHDHPIDDVLVSDILTLLKRELPQPVFFEEKIIPPKRKRVAKNLVFHHIRTSFSKFNPAVIALVILQLCVIVALFVFFSQLFTMGYIGNTKPHPNEWWYTLALALCLALSFVGTLGVLLGSKKCFYAVCVLDVIELVLIGSISALVYSKGLHFSSSTYIALRNLGHSFTKVPFHVVIMAFLVVCHCALMRLVLMIKKNDESAWALLR